jgi:hypothetical protein
MTQPSSQPTASSQAENFNAPRADERIPLWVSIVVVLGALLTLSGAVTSKLAPTLLTNGGAVTEAMRVYADYTFARDLALALMLVLLLALRARRMLAGIMVLLVVVQLVDVFDDLTRGAYVLVPGVLVLAIVFLVGAWTLFGQAVWNVDARRDAEGKPSTT